MLFWTTMEQENSSVKISLYKASIDTCMCTINKNNEYALRCFERKILIKVYGPICDNNIARKCMLSREQQIRSLS